LLLGLKGTMSEAELHVLRARLIGGQRAKASRGELEMKLPIGLIHDPVGKVVLDPDLQVQAAVRTFFETFRRTGSATSTVRSFREQGLLFPRRVNHGAHKDELAWGPLLHWRALRALKNPRYTGAFVYGRSQARRTAQGSERRILLPREQWHTLIRDAHPGYITWAEYEENLGRLHDNGQAYGADRRHGPPREGPALLQGIAVCGRCGGRMTIRYYVSHSEVLPAYVCQREGIDHAHGPCQRIVGGALDRTIGDLLVETVSPLAMEVAWLCRTSWRTVLRRWTGCDASRWIVPATPLSLPSGATSASIPTTAWSPILSKRNGTPSCVCSPRPRMTTNATMAPKAAR
jgi:hypothetical protein